MSIEVPCNLLQSIWWKLFNGNSAKTEFYVGEFLLPVSGLPESSCRVQQLISLTKTSGKFTSERILRPSVTFGKFAAVLNSFVNAPKLPAVAGVIGPIRVQIARAQDGHHQQDTDFDKNRHALTSSHAFVTAAKLHYTALIPFVTEVLTLLKSAEGFSISDEMTALQAAKDSALKASQAASAGLSAELDKLNTSLSASAMAFPQINYFTDTAFHASLESMTGRKYTRNWAKSCSCPKAKDLGGWIRACRNDDKVVNVDGHETEFAKKTAFWCVRDTMLTYQTYMMAEVIDTLAYSLASQEESDRFMDQGLSDVYRGSKATWDGTNSKVSYVSVGKGSLTTAAKFSQLVQGLGYQLSVEDVLNEQWARMSRTVQHLKKVKQAGADAVPQVEKFIKALEDVTGLLTELDTLYNDCYEIITITGAKAVAMHSISTDAYVLYQRISAILTELAKPIETLKHPQTDIAVCRYFEDHALRMANWSAGDAYRKSQLLITNGVAAGNDADVVKTRFSYTVPYWWYSEGVGSILAGFSVLDFSTKLNTLLDLKIAKVDNYGFSVDGGHILDRRVTDCYNMEFTYMQIPDAYIKQNAWMDGTLAIGSPDFYRLNPSEFLAKPQELKVTVPEALAKKQPRFEVLLRGVNLAPPKEYKASVDSEIKGSDYVIKYQNDGDSGIDYFSAQWIAWDPTVVKAVAKTFKTKKLGGKDNQHTEVVDFGGVFATKPKVMYGVKGFQLSHGDLRLKSWVDEVTKDHAVIKVETWFDTEITASFLCFALA